MNTKTLNSIIKSPKKYAEEVSIKELEDTLRKLSEIYYNTGDSQVSDEIFDLMKDILKTRDPKNKFLEETGAELSQSASKEKVMLPYPMKSLDKIKPDTTALEKFVAEYRGPYILSDKLDGVSAMIYKNGKGEIKMYSRGNGIKGQDISHLIKYVVPKDVDFNKMKNETAIRGEIIMTKENFKLIADKMANARNAVAGQINSKHIDIKIVRLMNFVAYSVINPQYKQADQMEKLETMNFDTVTYKIVDKISNDMLSKYLVDRRKNSDYEVDGVVVVDSSKVYKVDDSNPEYAFAFKTVLGDQVSETIVEDVIWNPSKDGLLKPRIQIQPVKVSGTTIKFATAFNGKYVLDNKLGPGSVIKIVRSGDVIPHILEVVKPATKAKMPDVPYKWSASGVDVMIKDIFNTQIDATTNQIKVKQLDHFFSTLEVKSIGSGILTKMVEKGYNTVEKILSAKKSDLIDIEGIGEKMITKIFDNIKTSFATTKLSVFMTASNIFGCGLGTKKLQLIIDNYPDIMNNKWKKEEFVEKLNAIDGFSDKTTLKFIDNLDNFKTFFDNINKIIDISHLNKPVIVKAKGNKFEKEIVVFTGFRDKELEKIVTDNGGKISSSVSSKTTLVVYAESASDSSKLTKAKDLKIKTMTDGEFKKKFM